MDATPHVAHRAEQRYVSLRDVVPMDQVSRIADRFGEVFGWLGAQGVAPAGAPFLRYNEIDMPRQLDIEAGVPVDADLEAQGEIVFGVLPAGHYATVDHVGPFDGLMDATAGLLEWAGDQDLRFDMVLEGDTERWACRLELYLTDPSEETDPQRYRTQLAFRLAD